MGSSKKMKCQGKENEAGLGIPRYRLVLPKLYFPSSSFPVSQSTREVFKKTPTIHVEYNSDGLDGK